ncbi:MAG TPA: mandelate racemase/muconate lactonizing enzyme family protein [Gemmataceae bacterium]|jgi:L-alanine-DL-glutamate epimerase-like enolase superfamily enzyme|nr:mandelate racemase/muconate lactonizing enzyme family protein [Gemmataceae bacterium]
MKITSLETIHLPEYPSILFVGVHTDAGLSGYADTCYAPDAVAGYIHKFAAPMLLGHDPLAIELHWRRLYEVIAHTVGKGAELRGLSALDVCLWDILGQSAGMPIWQVLGGAVRDRIKTYNTCGGPSYGRAAKGGTGYGTESADGKYEDLTAFMLHADELALDLLSEGLTGMKIWPFDYVAHVPGNWDNWRTFRGMFDPDIRTLGGHDISASDINRALEPFRKIRKAVGDRMDVMLEGHGLWSLPTALKIARAVEEYQPAWLEDLMRADDVDALAELRRATTTPILASEYLATRYEYKPLLEARAADIVMIDPTWAGGITECKKVCAMAETYKRPVAMHDCTGPLTLYAGIHLAINAPNAVYQESVRAYLRVNYPELVTELPTIEAGHILAPTKPGLGSTLLPDIRARPGATVRETRA